MFRDSTVCSKEVQIPDRIERSPTDILRAISGTVSTDFTAPHYRFRTFIFFDGFNCQGDLKKSNFGVIFSFNILPISYECESQLLF